MKLELNKRKWLVSLSSIFINLLIWIPIIYINHSTGHISVWLPIKIFSTIYILNIMTTGLLIYLFANKILERKNSIAGVVTVVSISSLSFIIGFVLNNLLNKNDPYLILIGILAWGILTSIGISKLYNSNFFKSSILTLGILVPILFAEAIFLRFF